MKISDEESRFGQVPDVELLACRRRKYARESRTLRGLLKSAGNYDPRAVPRSVPKIQDCFAVCASVG